MNAESEKSLNKLRDIIDLDDEERKFIRTKEAEQIYSIGRKVIYKIAKKSGAFYKVGKIVMINKRRFEEGLEIYFRFSEEEQE